MAVVSARSIVLLASMLVLGGSARAAEAVKECPPGMLLVPGGTFRMGSEDGYPDEWPVLPRKVESFCLDRTEVTVEAYLKFLKERNEDVGVVVARWPEIVRGEVRDWTSFCNLNIPGREQHPVN